MDRPRSALTSVQNIVLDLVFEVMGEERINRTQREYMAIAARLPALKVLEFKVNKKLRELHKSFRDPEYRKKIPIGSMKFLGLGPVINGISTNRFQPKFRTKLCAWH